MVAVPSGLESGAVVVNDSEYGKDKRRIGGTIVAVAPTTICSGEFMFSTCFARPNSTLANQGFLK